MATKKKSKKKSTGSKKTARGKVTAAKKRAKKPGTSKRSAKSKSLNKAAATQKRAKRTVRAKRVGESPKQTRKISQRDDSSIFSPGAAESQSGDLEGLSNVESADSESVEELIEEGNAFEAGVVSGVEDAGRRGTREVRTREVPEDDVPQEYLDKD